MLSIRPALLLLACLAAPWPTQAAAPGAVPLHDCRLSRPGGGGVAARCATLDVAEDYAVPSGSRIRLRLAVVPAVSGRPAEPLFILAGGPGQAATDFYAAVSPAFSLVARTHDLVLVDQRGTGGSNRLDCAFPDDFSAQTPPAAEIERLSAACVAGLAGRPQFYTTSVAVRDLDAVREALGYANLSLYGASYGTRVAQHYARRHPERVRGLILDGVVAPDDALGPQIALGAQRALELGVARCAADAACHAAFADPDADLRRVRADLAREQKLLSLTDPASGQPVSLRFGNEQLGSALRLMSYSASTMALVPLLLHTAAGGDLRPLAGQFLLFSHDLDAQIAYGMHNAVACTEDIPFLGAVDRAALERTYLGVTELDSLLAMCRPWPRGVRDADLRAPLHASAPALLLSGEADPITPPEGAERAARGFASSRHIVLRGQGHGQLGTGCVPELMARFLDTHRADTLDATCAERARPTAFFIDYSGPAP